MKKRRHDTAYLTDIKTAAELAISFIQGLSKEDFERDLMRQSAVIRQIEIIGEATKRLSPEFRSSHPNIPWKKMAGMRDILIHAYHEADITSVWKAIKLDLPNLLKSLVPLLLD